MYISFASILLTIVVVSYFWDRQDRREIDARFEAEYERDVGPRDRLCDVDIEKEYEAVKVERKARRLAAIQAPAPTKAETLASSDIESEFFS